MPSFRKLLPLYIGLFVIILDFVTKYYTQANFPIMQHWMKYPYGGVGVFKDFMGIEFSLTHQINYGAAWGMLAHYQKPLLYVRIVMIGCLTFYALFMNNHRAWDIPLALIIAGAIGNVIDYFIYGHVVDMFHFILWGYDFPVFNVADSAITLGIISMILLSFLEKKSPATHIR